MAQKPWFLYILECAGERLYTGITVDVEARYAAHAKGKGAKFTKGFPPQQILFQAEFPDRSTASRAEIDFKRLSAQEKRRFIARHAQNAQPAARPCTTTGMRTRRFGRAPGDGRSCSARLFWQPGLSTTRATRQWESASLSAFRKTGQRPNHEMAST